MKKLEEEYKKACAEETPDLWNRIEAGLPPKAEQPAKADAEPAADASQKQGKATEAGTGATETGALTQAAIRKVWIRYGAFVAAAVMVLVTVPGLFRMTQAKSTNENAAADIGNAAYENGMQTAGIADTGAASEEFMEESDSLQQDTADTEMAAGVSSMVLKVTSIEEYDDAELVGVVSDDGTFETRLDFPKKVKEKLDFSLTEGEYYLFTLKQEKNKSFPGYHILAVEQTEE